MHSVRGTSSLEADATEVRPENSFAFVEAMLVKRHKILLRFGQQPLPVWQKMCTSCRPIRLLLRPDLLPGLDCRRTHVPRSTAPPVEYRRSPRNEGDTRDVLLNTAEEIRRKTATTVFGSRSHLPRGRSGVGAERDSVVVPSSLVLYL